MFFPLQLFDLWASSLGLSWTVYIRGIKVSSSSFPHLYDEDETNLFLKKLWRLNETLTRKGLYSAYNIKSAESSIYVNRYHHHQPSQGLSNSAATYILNLPSHFLNVPSTFFLLCIFTQTIPVSEMHFPSQSYRSKFFLSFAMYSNTTLFPDLLNGSSLPFSNSCGGSIALS